MTSSRSLAAGLLVSSLFALSACNGKSSGISSNVSPLPSGFRFTDVHVAAGIDFKREIGSYMGPVQLFAGGVAAGDYDQDGHVDLYVIGDKAQGNFLYRNRGDGTFEERAAAAGIRLTGGYWSGATFGDFNGDGRPDLLVCGVHGTLPCLLANLGDGTFADATPKSGLDQIRTDTLGAAYGDYDRDGDLDLFLTQWGVAHAPGKASMHLWRNKGGGIFEDVSLSAGVTEALGGLQGFTDMTMAASFTDLDGDAFLDLVVTGDQGGSRLLRNDGKGGFAVMAVDGADLPYASGSAIGDVDNDGQLDLFLSGAYRAGDPNRPGNRMLIGDGQGGFTDGTLGAGVRDGSLGFASSFADFDNSGSLDLIQVNGLRVTGNEPEAQDRSRLFINNGTGVFVDRAAETALDDFEMGRGLVCFDFDGDGDQDVFVVNLLGEPRLWRNDGGNSRSHVCVRLEYITGNKRGAGALIKVISQGRSQVRELRLGSNFTSQNPIEAHFGLGTADSIEAIEVRWPDGLVSRYGPFGVNQVINLRR